MSTMDDILAEAGKRGLILNNLFQLRTYPADSKIPSRATGEWQANFMTVGGWHDFGRGKTYIEALQDALERASGKLGPENRPIPRGTKPRDEAPELEDLI